MNNTSDDSTSNFFGYACPQSHKPLQVVSDICLMSTETNQTFTVTDGIPSFLRYPPAETLDMTAKSQRLIELGRQHGWEKALREVEPETLAYLLAEKRAKYLDLLPLTSTSRVLEIGASKGQHTCLIARRCRSLYALEVVKEQAFFANLWCSQLSQSNVKFAIGGDDGRLPYFDRFFDIVILNHVFEWCANRADEDFTAVQMRMLSECYRVIAPGGCLFLSTKNRFSARLLAGAIDEHVDFRFGNALPRRIMTFLLRRHGQVRPRGLLYSYDQLKEMILKSGFESVESYWAVPDARYPKTYIQHKRSEIAKARKDMNVRQSSKLTNILLRYAPAYLIPRIAPSLVFLAYKS